EKKFFRRLQNEIGSSSLASATREEPDRQGQRFTYRPRSAQWRQVWVSLAAVMLLALALGIAVYRSVVERRTDVAQKTPELSKSSSESLEEQLSDAGYEQTHLLSRLAEQDRTIADLRRKLEEQQKAVSALKSANGDASAPRGAGNSNDSSRVQENLAKAQ